MQSTSLHSFIRSTSMDTVNGRQWPLCYQTVTIDAFERVDIWQTHTHTLAQALANTKISIFFDTISMTNDDDDRYLLHYTAPFDHI